MCSANELFYIIKCQFTFKSSISNHFQGLRCPLIVIMNLIERKTNRRTVQSGAMFGLRQLESTKKTYHRTFSTQKNDIRNLFWHRCIFFLVINQTTWNTGIIRGACTDPLSDTIVGRSNAFSVFFIVEYINDKQYRLKKIGFQNKTYHRRHRAGN